ncbi:MAG: hypothetical protein PWR03_2339, partial [Tenuifilum sp.]
MTMSSIVKFRWINLTGALLFSIYGFLIGAWPVGILNGIIVLTDAYYLVLIYSKKDVFEILEVSPYNKYLIRFLDFHKKDINRYFPDFSYTPNEGALVYLILRNMAVAGVFIAHKNEDKAIEVELDYVLPEYRDFKNGKFVYYWLSNKFAESGFTRVWAKACSKSHKKYLTRMGFTESGGNHFLKIFE